MVVVSKYTSGFSTRWYLESNFNAFLNAILWAAPKQGFDGLEIYSTFGWTIKSLSSSVGELSIDYK